MDTWEGQEGWQEIYLSSVMCPPNSSILDPLVMGWSECLQTAGTLAFPSLFSLFQLLLPQASLVTCHPYKASIGN